VNEKWYGCIPIVSPAPQPDYSIGFNESAFSQSQLEKLGPFIEGWKYTPFLATTSIYFPFLTCEVKCGNEALNIADRQNAHNGSVAVKQLVNLYREVSRESELDRKILAFSVSHDHRYVRMYGHYALISGDITSFHRYLIDSFDIIPQDGRDKWTAYKFILNVYKTFVPTHLERIRTAIDQLPGPVSQPSQQPRGESASQLGLNDSQSNSRPLARYRTKYSIVSNLWAITQEAEEQGHSTKYSFVSNLWAIIQEADEKEFSGERRRGQ